MRLFDEILNSQIFHAYFDYVDFKNWNLVRCLHDDSDVI